MNTVLLWILGAATAICGLSAALLTDRMANELRDTQDPRYADPYAYGEVRDWFGFRRFRMLLDTKYRERFPKSTLRTKAHALGFLTLVLGFTLIWMLHSNKVQQQVNDAQTLQDLGR